MKLFFSAIGLLLIFEGLPYFLNPGGTKKMAEFLMNVEPKSLRITGFVLMLTGLLILYVVNVY